jgi:dolichol-phosphate mannosyltransferase
VFEPQPTSEESRAPAVRFSVVIPCYNEEESIPALLNALVPYLEKSTRGSWEIIFVDDGSSDRTGELIAAAHRKENRVRGIVLSRNFGHQPAIFAGLAYASGDYVGIMDADLQDPPGVLMECFQKAQQEGYDLVYAVRKRRQASWPLKIAYWTFYRLMRALAEYSWPLDAGDFSVFNQQVRRLIMQLPEHVRVLRGLRSWVGLKQGFVNYERPNRGKGASKYNLLKLFGLALNALISFSNVPLRLATLVGISMSLLSILLGLLLVLNRFFPKFTLFGYYIGANPGTTTIVILLLLIGSLLFLCLGIIGEYLGVVIKEVKRRPVAIVQHRVGLNNSQVHSRLILEAVEPKAI